MKSHESNRHTAGGTHCSLARSPDELRQAEVFLLRLEGRQENFSNCQLHDTFRDRAANHKCHDTFSLQICQESKGRFHVSGNFIRRLSGVSQS